MSQSESNNSPLGMRIGESVFCIGYLVFALIAGIVMLSRYDGNQYMLYAGIMVLVLCFGDSFHLVPRIIRNVRGPCPCPPLPAFGMFISSPIKVTRLPMLSHPVDSA